ncbi:MAG: RNA polymerase sigma factor [Thermoleophilia bacterium]
MTDPELPTPPTDEERRRAAALAMGAAPGLIRFASRYTRSLQDAEDAYQRAMEIALTRAPVVEPRRFMAWLHTVLRNEAIAIARARRREGPGAAADVAEEWGEVLAARGSTDATAEWRDRYRIVQDGLAGLSEAQRTCLMLQAAGVSYDRIREITGFSLRKVERSVLEGRRNLAAWEVRLATGEACALLDDAIGRVACGSASSKERRRVGRHVRHCGPCRATLRNRRESEGWMASLVPIGLVAGQVTMDAPDPSPALAWWDRVAGSATVRAGNAVQMAMEVPGAVLAKVGAGTAAVTLAGVTGAPLVIDAVAPEHRPATAVAAQPVVVDGAVITEAGRRTADRAQASFTRARRTAVEQAERRRAREQARRRDEERRRAENERQDEEQMTAQITPPDDPPYTPPAPSAPAAAAPSAAPAAAAVALEFGP